MAEKANLNKAARAIRLALKAFVAKDERDNVQFFESSPGSLRFIVGSDRFKGVGPVDRQDMVWDHLKKHVEDDSLSFCSGVHAYDLDEYEEAFFPQDMSSSVAIPTTPEEDVD